jgi:lysophospholipase L1-like esterase
VLKKGLWFSILLLSIAGVAALSAGLYDALRVTGSVSRPAATPAPPAGDETAPAPAAAVPRNSNALSLVILGDSVARGTGDLSGKGFSSYLPEYLKSLTPREIVVQNAGVDGLQSQGLLDLIAGGALQRTLAEADIILLSIGGNDLRRIRRNGEVTREETFRVTSSAYQRALQSMLQALRRQNAAALIIVIGLYNPSEQEATADDMGFLLAWNEGTENLIAREKRAIFIPTYDLFKFNGAKLVAPDRLHPNAAGYQAIANRIARSIEGYFNGALPTATP